MTFNTTKLYLHDGISRLLQGLGATDLRSRLSGRLVILTFHRVLTVDQRSNYPFPNLAVTPEELDDIIRWVSGWGEVMTVSEAWRSLQTRDSDHPLIALTFDDGQLDNYLHAVPVLKRHGVPATFYVVTDSVETGAPLWHDLLAYSVMAALAEDQDKWLRELKHAGLTIDKSNHAEISADFVRFSKSLPAAERKNWLERLNTYHHSRAMPDWDGMMNWHHLAELLDLGYEIGAHSSSHALLTQCTSQELKYEIDDALATLETRLQRPVFSYCYPSGFYNQATLSAISKTGLENAVTTDWGDNERLSSAMNLRRFDIDSGKQYDRHGRFSAARLAWRFSGIWPYRFAPTQGCGGHERSGA